MRSADYVELTTTSIAGTLGDGAVTMIAVTNRPTITLALGSSKLWLRYLIEDTVLNKFEQGIGSVASGVLTRTKPQITWDGVSAWSDQSPSALQFGASPTSGNVRIRLGALAESSNVGLIDVRQSTIAGDSNWRDYPISAHIAFGGSGATSTTLTADREYYTYYDLRTPGLLQGMQFEVITAVAATNLKWALYDLGSDGLPGAKLVDFVTTATATTGFKTDTATGSWTPSTPPRLTPGWYAIGFIANGAIAIRAPAGGNQGNITPAGRKNGYGYGNGMFVAGNYTTGLPAVPSLGSATMMDPGTASGGYWLGMKVVP